jgi:serine/threonine-protein kinase
VLADLTLLSTVDAVGVKALMDAARAHPEAQLAVLAPATHIRRALEQSGAGDVLRIFRNRQQAVTALVGPEHLRLASETIGGLYQIVELLFADESGVIYRGTDQRQQAPILVRVVAGQSSDPAREEFTHQVRDWQRLRHPILLPCTDIVSGVAWVASVCAMPQGVSLREWRSGRRRWAEIWLTAEKLVQGLAELHRLNVVHGDLRPEKIVVEATGEVRIARMALFPHPVGQGPAAYRAPEQLRGQPATLRTDVYLLGLILYELLLGAPAFAAETEELRLTLQLYSQPQSPRIHWPEIPEALEKLLLRMLAASPDDRFASGEEVAAAFTALTPSMFPAEPGRRGTGPLNLSGQAPPAGR